MDPVDDIPVRNYDNDFDEIFQYSNQHFGESNLDEWADNFDISLLPNPVDQSYLKTTEDEANASMSREMYLNNPVNEFDMYLQQNPVYQPQIRITEGELNELVGLDKQQDKWSGVLDISIQPIQVDKTNVTIEDHTDEWSENNQLLNKYEAWPAFNATTYPTVTSGDNCGFQSTESMENTIERHLKEWTNELHFSSLPTPVNEINATIEDSAVTYSDTILLPNQMFNKYETGPMLNTNTYPTFTTIDSFGKLTAKCVDNTRHVSNVINQPFFVNEIQKANMTARTSQHLFECLECEIKFTTESLTKVRMNIHTRKTPYQCTECQKYFTTYGNLKRHMRTHAGIKPYECTECQMRFTEYGTLKVHMRIHADIKPYECTECQKRYTQSSNLKVHMRTHAGTKHYECTECQMRFTEYGTLKAHMRIHAGIKPYECTVCQLRFTFSSSLKRHTRRKCCKTVQAIQLYKRSQAKHIMGE